MNICRIEKKVRSSDRVHMLNGLIFVPQGRIKGYFHIIHGMTEYIGRYEDFMKEMAGEGYIVFGYDNLGHGFTVNDESERGFFASENGWKYLVEDVGIFAREMKKHFGLTLPYYLMGHSMGSFIARLAAEKFNMQKKLILTGTGGPENLTGSAIAVLRRVKKDKGEKYVSERLRDMIFGTYNKKFGDDDPYNWLSSLETARNEYSSDPVCTFSFTVSAMEDLVTLSREANSRRWFSSRVCRKPVLILSGLDDPVGEYGHGVKKVHDKLAENGCNVRLILYRGCRHEVLNERCRKKAIHEIKRFCL